MNGSFDALFRKGSIGQLQLKNRLVMAPMGTNFSAEGGFVAPQLVEYYRQRALGGVGLIIVQAALVAPEGRVNYRQLASLRRQG